MKTPTKTDLNPPKLSPLSLNLVIKFY